MNAIGFIGKDYSCFNQFTATNPTTLTWTSPTLGTVTRPVLPAEYQAYVDARNPTQTPASSGGIAPTTNNVSSEDSHEGHDHEKAADVHTFKAEQRME